jgi:hypothetical protein
MKKFCLLLILVSFQLPASIQKIDHIEDIKKEVSANTLVLLNIAEVVLDTENSLGTQQWRKYLRANVSSPVHDKVTFFVFKNVPPKAVEENTSTFIKSLQDSGVTVLGFTSRGRNEWYDTKIEKVDQATEKALNKIGVDFSRTKLPPKLEALPLSYYHDGILYATNSVDKGELLKEILQKTGYKPAKIIYVDDKENSLKEVEKVINSLNIPFYGYYYPKTAKIHKEFDPMVATIELYFLVNHHQVISDEEAKKLKSSRFSSTSEKQLFSEIHLNDL